LFCHIDNYSNIIFGPTLTEAYDIESKHSIYPRVVIAPDVRQLLFSYLPRELTEPFKLANDGKYYLDILRIFPKWQETTDIKREQQDFLNRVRPQIDENLANFSNEWRVLEKYCWFARYFNEIASEFEVRPVKIPIYSTVKREYLERELEIIKRKETEILQELEKTTRLDGSIY
jgi:hypothetical protein